MEASGQPDLEEGESSVRTTAATTNATWSRPEMGCDEGLVRLGGSFYARPNHKLQPITGAVS